MSRELHRELSQDQSELGGRPKVMAKGRNFPKSSLEDIDSCYGGNRRISPCGC